MPDSIANGEAFNGHFIAYYEEFYEVTGDDPSFYTVIETNAHEGPVYVENENALYFTTVPANSNVPLAGFKQVSIKRISLAGNQFPLDPSAETTVRAASNMANGMTLDREGRLVICEQGTKSTVARISRMDLETAVHQMLAHRRTDATSKGNSYICKPVNPSVRQPSSSTMKTCHRRRLSQRSSRRACREHIIAVA